MWPEKPLTVRVASIRKIRWDSFRPNFFLVFPPGLLDGAAGTYMTSLYLTAAQRPALADLVRQFPTISVFDVDAILKQIRDIMDRASLAVQYVFLFTLAAGIVVLLAAVQSTRDERRYESAMLRTLGASRGTVLQGVAAEFSALGFLSGTLAAFGATGVGWILARRLFSLEFTLDPWVWVVGLGLRHHSRGRERHAGDAQRGQHAADRDACATSDCACRAALSALRGSASRWESECRAAAALRCAPCRCRPTRPVELSVKRNSPFESLSRLLSIRARP